MPAALTGSAGSAPAGPGAAFGFVPDVGEEADLGEIWGEGADDVDADAPGVDVHHGVGEDPIVVGGNVGSVIGVAGGDIEAAFL